MAWYWIVLIVPGPLYALCFLAYITNDKRRNEACGKAL